MAKENENKEIEKFDSQLDEFSQSQIERASKILSVQNDLLDMLSMRIDLIKDQSEIEKEVEKILLERVIDEDSEMSDGNLIKLFALLKRNKIDEVTSLVAAIKGDKDNAPISPGSGNVTGYGDESDLTAEDLKQLKDLHEMTDILKKVKNSKEAEMSAEEIKNK